MDWSKAKSLLIIAFLAVNIFLASQLIKAKGEQTQNQEVSQVTQLQLEELIADRNIRIPDNLPQKAFPVTYLEAEPTKPESLLEQSDQWEPVEEGRYRIRFQPPLATGKELESILERYVPDFQTYREWRRPNPDEKVYYQHLDHRPIFDDRLIVRLENGNIKELELLPVDVRVDQDNKTQTGLSAQDALVKLVETGRIKKGSTVTDVTLGYHGQFYEGESRFLFPVWRIQTEELTFYVNALTSEIETISLD